MVSAYDAFIRKSLVPESECKKMDKDQAIQKLKTEVKMLSKEELITLYEMSVIENTSLAEENEKLESELAQSKQDYSARMRHNPEKGPNKNWVYEAMKKLDGFAAVNLEEPSPGDLKRVYSAYVALQEDYDALKAELSQRKHDYSANMIHKTEVIVKLEKEIERLKDLLISGRMLVILDEPFWTGIQYTSFRHWALRVDEHFKSSEGVESEG